MSFLHQQQLKKEKKKDNLLQQHRRLHESFFFFREKSQLKYLIYELNSYLQVGDRENMQFLNSEFFSFPEFSIFITTLPILLSHTISSVPISFP